MAEPAIAQRENVAERVSEADSSMKVPGPNPKAEILLRPVATSLLLPLVSSCQGKSMC
jgi:hypothetical protein